MPVCEKQTKVIPLVIKKNLAKDLMQPLPAASSSDPRVSTHSRLALNTDRKPSPDVTQRIGPLPSPTGSAITSSQSRQITQLDAGSDTTSSESSAKVSDPKSDSTRSDSTKSDVDNTMILFGRIQIVRKEKKPKEKTDSGSKTSAANAALPQPVELEVPLKDKVDKFCKGDQEALSPAVIKNLAPQSRLKLLAWCKWQEASGKLGASPRLLGERIDSFQKAKMNVRFIEAVNGYKDADFISGLCLNNECVIDTKVFLEIILQALRDEKLKAHHSELSGLCIRWAAENCGTKWLDEKRVDLKSQKEVPNETRILLNKIAELAPGLKSLLDLKPREKAKPALNDGAKALVNFEKTLEEIYCFEYGAAVASYAETIADDLLHYQVQVLSQIEEKDLVDKWKVRPPSVQRSLHFQESLSNYIADLVLRFPDLSQRARVLSFFVLLCDAACRRGDFSSAMAISGALSMSDISRLKDTWKQVTANAQLNELCNQLSNLFDPVRNQANFRAAMNTRAQQGKIVRFMGLLQKDIMFSQEGGASIVAADDGEPKYNLERVKDCRKMIRDYLAPIVSLKEGLAKYEPKTNFVHLCLVESEKCSNSNERYNQRERQSEKYEPAKHAAQKA